MFLLTGFNFIISSKVQSFMILFCLNIIAVILVIQVDLISNNYHLNMSAKDAYRSYILAYSSHSMKDIFDVHRLDLKVLYILSIETSA